MGRDVTSRDVAWREMTRRDVMCHGVPFIWPGERFCRTRFRCIGTSRNNNGWGNLNRAGGNFFRGRIWKHRDIFHNVGGTWHGPGELFFLCWFGNISKSLHNSAWGNLDRAGGTFFGAGFGHIKQISTNGGGTWPGPGIFFRELSYLTLTKARTPTARRC